MRISTNQMQQTALNSMLDQQTRLSKTQNQVSIGKRVLTPADDPIASASILDLRQSIDVTDQQKLAGDAAKSRLGIEDATLTSVGDILQRVRELAVQAGNSSLSNDDRRFLAAEVKQSLDAVLSLANTTDSNGDYLFSGYQSKVKPFAPNGSGGFSYSGDDGQRLARVGPSLYVANSDAGSAVFRNIKNGNGTFQTAAGGANQGSAVIDPGTVSGTFVPDTYTLAFAQVPLSNPPSYTYTVTNSAAVVIAGPTAYADGAEIDLSAVGIKSSIRGAPADLDTFTLSSSSNQDVFQTIQNFANALETPFGGAPGQAAYGNGLNNVLVNLDRSMNNVLDTQVKIGTRINSIDQQTASGEAFKVQLQDTLSSLEDLDYAEAISRLNLQSAGLQAAQQSFVRIQGLSLFNYLR